MLAKTEELTVEKIIKFMEERKYVTDESIAMAIYLALTLKKPLLIEGEAGCGKTEIAKILSDILDTELIRLQCYEGLDVNSAIYEWDYLRQLLKIRLEESKKKPEEIESSIFSERFLLKRPLLKAVLKEDKEPVLLIDEIDRADEEFEGFLLEFLAEFQVTIPEIGTLRARKDPIVILTSNRTREIGDGIRRRCLYLYLTYPTLEKEVKIVRLKSPNINERLSLQICRFVKKLRESDEIIKKPGISETLDWASSLTLLHKDSLDIETVQKTLSCLLKSSQDVKRFDYTRIKSILDEIEENESKGEFNRFL
ncbi:MAG: MoxR family ATPase [Nitrososphaerales archaeon]